ncbi:MULTISPECIES: hypothetical protein [unclassified Inquilinus]|uniref:hypothetical protein n=1 Tax=unclassified Inquilinus TaxID=2645927 RepID=UPI003F93E1BB
MAILRGVNKLAARPPQAASLAAKTPGEMSAGLDLYGILYNAATQTNSLDSFAGAIESALDAALGPSNYVTSLALAENGHGSAYTTFGNKLPNAAVWCGDAGVLPGVVSSYFVMLTVFTA